LEKLGDIRLYVKCKDVNGNENVAPYLIDLCVKSGPDLTPPMIIGTEPALGGFVKYGVEEQNVTFFINEPAECHWELSNDEDFDLMPNNMNCKTGLNEATKHGWPCETTFPVSDNSTYYVRCKDKPWFAGTMNESDRIENSVGLGFSLQTSAGELVIDSIEPSEDFEIRVEPSAVTLEVETSIGAEGGTSACYYRFDENNNWMKFFISDSTHHEQDFDYMFAGRHEIFVKCGDIAGNVAEDSTKFKIIKDTSSPQVARVYVAGGSIKIITTESADCRYSTSSCSFDFDSGTSAGSGVEHSLPLSYDTYYIKCADEHGNVPRGCSVVMRGVNYA